MANSKRASVGGIVQRNGAEGNGETQSAQALPFQRLGALGVVCLVSLLGNERLRDAGYSFPPAACTSAAMRPASVVIRPYSGGLNSPPMKHLVLR